MKAIVGAGGHIDRRERGGYGLTGRIGCGLRTKPVTPADRLPMSAEPRPRRVVTPRMLPRKHLSPAGQGDVSIPAPAWQLGGARGRDDLWSPDLLIADSSALRAARGYRSDARLLKSC
ncbi:hypothetical protein [Nocardia sp. NPDC059691]|uniref:hypothetical protein n=1 Tax=Nocardia sp. NPDC059691 TaxID=3346908 RepID=UPI0036A63A6C